MADDLEKLAEQVEEQTETLKEVRRREGGRGDAAVPEEIRHEQGDLDEELRGPLKQLDEIAEKR